MNKFKEWLWHNRTRIGYTIGVLNVLTGVNYAVTGDYGLAVLWIVIGSFIIYDVKTYR